MISQIEVKKQIKKVNSDEVDILVTVNVIIVCRQRQMLFLDCMRSFLSQDVLDLKQSFLYDRNYSFSWMICEKV